MVYSNYLSEDYLKTSRIQYNFYSITFKILVVIEIHDYVDLIDEIFLLRSLAIMRFLFFSL